MKLAVRKLLNEFPRERLNDGKYNRSLSIWYSIHVCIETKWNETMINILISFTQLDSQSHQKTWMNGKRKLRMKSTRKNIIDHWLGWIIIFIHYFSAYNGLYTVLYLLSYDPISNKLLILTEPSAKAKKKKENRGKNVWRKKRVASIFI